ncbi:hypothetical protein Ppro_1584 [Pelobacter propionicus DSM 2379]|uniref:Uncharacterized protein n=1 Tax=Pelobacter propionicus (strain DSM 2379 / NBRC 103807 / OttBd1) TaxID=338966 RepID=A1APC9_PELPD|nr:hypothetical protein Ppro_1584 [Pelobacter propionicus DSM 2379]
MLCFSDWHEFRALLYELFLLLLVRLLFSAVCPGRGVDSREAAPSHTTKPGQTEVSPAFFMQPHQVRVQEPGGNLPAPVRFVAKKEQR